MIQGWIRPKFIFGMYQASCFQSLCNAKLSPGPSFIWTQLYQSSDLNLCKKANKCTCVLCASLVCNNTTKETATQTQEQTTDFTIEEVSPIRTHCTWNTTMYKGLVFLTSSHSLTQINMVTTVRQPISGQAPVRRDIRLVNCSRESEWQCLW